MNDKIIDELREEIFLILQKDHFTPEDYAEINKKLNIIKTIQTKFS